MNLIGAGIETSREKQPAASSGNAEPPVCLVMWIYYEQILMKMHDISLC